MASMSTSDLKALLQAEKADALGTDTASELVKQRSDAMDYYLGDMSKDMPHQEGRSKAVSTDVSDTIEGLMPSLMEIFAAGDEVVSFEPVGPEDEDAASQETDYVNHVFMQQLPGFMILYTYIKDALAQKNGIVKGWWEESEIEDEETYLDQDEDTYTALVQSAEEAGYEVAEHSLSEDGLHDVTFRRVRSYGCAKVENVPPEEFGITRRAKSIRDADYCYHETARAESVLIEQGYDAEQIKTLPSKGDGSNSEETARDTVEDDRSNNGDGLNKATRLITVTEHYVKMDYDGSGKARLWRITTGGDDSVVLTRDGKPDVVKVDIMPFAAMTPIIMPHRFFGRSVADLVMDIQRIKTALIRALLDNAYLANNPPTEIAESHAGERTLDDLLTARPGKVVRTKQPGGLVYHQVPTIGNHVFPMVEYFDATREWRTGVTRQGQGIDANALQNQSATAVNQAFTAAQARMKLIARIFAETGIRDLFSLLHAIIRKNDRQGNTVRLRGKWVQVDPRDWKTRNDMTISVGLGSGSKESEVAHLMNLLGIQQAALAGGGFGIVKPGNIYNTLKKIVERVGLKSVDPYFTDPEAVDEMGQPVNPPPESPPDPKMIQAQAKIQSDQMKAQADAQLKQQTAQVDAQLKVQQMQQEHEFKIAEMEREHALKGQQMQAEFTQKQQQMEAEIDLKARAMAEELRLKERMGILGAHVDIATSRVEVGGEPG